MYAPRVVHACTFLDVNVNADVNIVHLPDGSYRFRHRFRPCIRMAFTAPQDIQISTSPGSG